MDPTQALRILEEEAELARREPVDNEWVAHIRRLSDMCEGGAPKTHIALLGTALLAKATNAKVNPFALKVGADLEGAYSARALAKDVLAANAPRLGIDLGVSGREPLNNQPYFRGTNVRELRNVVRQDARSAYDLVVQLLDLLLLAPQDEARLALRAFLQVRKRKSRARDLLESTADVLERSFVASVAAFTAEQSDGGRRAQALAAGILDAMYPEHRVRVARVNDPDRRFPGDIAIVRPPSERPEYVIDSEREGKIEAVYEVRDKLVTDSDLFHFVDKAAQHPINRAAVIAAHRDQQPLLLKTAEAYAQRSRVKLTMFVHWGTFVSNALFYSVTDPANVLDLACKYIQVRLEELEVPEETMNRWTELVNVMERVPESL